MLGDQECSPQNLKHMRAFYIAWKAEIQNLQQPVGDLPIKFCVCPCVSAVKEIIKLRKGVTMAIQEGKTAPAFTLPDQNGNKVALKDFKGKNVILFFYPKDNTSGWTKEAQEFRDLMGEFQKKDVVILGISPDSEASHQKFIAQNDLPFTLLCDPEKKVMTQYEAFGEKKMYGKVVMGVIRSTVWVGPDGKVKKHWRKVAKAADHPHKVLEALQA